MTNDSTAPRQPLSFPFVGTEAQLRDALAAETEDERNARKLARLLAEQRQDREQLRRLEGVREVIAKSDAYPVEDPAIKADPEQYAAYVAGYRAVGARALAEIETSAQAYRRGMAKRSNRIHWKQVQARQRAMSSRQCPRQTHVVNRHARAKVAVRTVRASRPTRGAAKKTTSSSTGDPPPSEPDHSASLRSSSEAAS